MTGVALALLIQVAKPVTPALKATIVDQIGVALDTTGFVPGTDFSGWPQVAERHRKELEGAKTSFQFADALSKILASYGVSHIAVAPPGFGMNEKVTTFGFTVVLYHDRPVVQRVFEGTQAERVGLSTGMDLMGIRYVDNAKRDRLRILFQSADAMLHDVTVSTESFVPAEKPSLETVAPDAAVLRLPSFHHGYDAKRVDQLMAKAARYPYLLLDLRGNTGGLPTWAVHFLAPFLPAGTRIGAAVSKETLQKFGRETQKSAKEHAAYVAWAPKGMAFIVPEAPIPYKGHIAVLTDGQTGSASEIVVAALRDFAHAPVYGTPTGGHVLSMHNKPLAGGYILYFPSRDYWTANGERLESHPILPDVPADGDPKTPDPHLGPLRLKALAGLRAAAAKGG